ncbi:MAG: BBP7 family outer membrane beta-barrel protein [Planctomycetaceae bacterium]|nr:BBP7 family outer membrane beta-barrel protein [Planctomycetales bacterium]MCB9922499.1 BBP7 family outer membrane beta-barrel protein [Planctomycetaceae bacterium]
MRNSSRFIAVCLCLVALVSSYSRCVAEDQDEVPASRLRRELSSTRRVGYLRKRSDTESDRARFVLKDAYDKATYRIIEQPGLDLADFVDRYISLQGETEGGTDGSPLRFSAEQVTALDDQQPVSARATKVRPAAFAAADARPIEPPRDLTDVRVAALTDGLPAPSEVLGPGSPYSLEIETAPQSYTIEPPVTGFGWLRPPATASDGLGGRAWVRGEYLLWTTDSLRTPALITTSPTGTARATAGVLGEAGTSVLYGISSINNDSISGGRLRGGFWFGDAQKVGVEGDLFMLREQTSEYQATSTGDPIIARPFFDIVNGRETAELVAFPSVVRGDIQVTALTNLASGGIWMRFDPHGMGSPCEARSGRKLDWVIGYRSMKLEDDISIRENLTSLDTANPGTFVIEDGFTTDNKFNGVEVGAVYEADLGRFYFEALSKIAIGNNRQVVNITGYSDITEMGLLERFPGGVLAQRTNIGSYKRDEMSLIPQLGATIGWRVTPRFSLTAGYTFVYLSNVVRAGDQISTDINPNLFPPEAVPFSGALRPEFAWRETDFWAQGISLGGDYRW